MANASSSYSQPLITLFTAGSAVGLTDRELLHRFATQRGDSAEFAFSVLVERHGGLVFRVCRSVLGDRDEAEDAFQATFLVLARKARKIRVEDSLAPWIYGVARRVALRALTANTRRRRLLERFASWSTPTLRITGDDPTAPLLEELGRLPHRFQKAIRLCDLEGFSQDEAAKILDVPVHTIKNRIFRGRQRLRDGLLRRGLAPRVGLFVPAGIITVTVPPRLADLAVRAAVLELGGGGVVSSTVLALTEGTIYSMSTTKIKLAAVLVMGFGMVGGGLASNAMPGSVFGTTTQAPAEKTDASAKGKVAEIRSLAKTIVDLFRSLDLTEGALEWNGTRAKFSTRGLANGVDLIDVSNLKAEHDEHEAKLEILKTTIRGKVEELAKLVRDCETEPLASDPDKRAKIRIVATQVEESLAAERAASESYEEGRRKQEAKP